LKVLAMLLLTLRGTPFIYYGEEIGMRDIAVRRSEIKDPVGKRFWPFFKGRDGCRSPMQWDGSLYAGFSNNLPWLPVHPNHTWRNVESQRADMNSLFNFYRRLIQLRREFPALRKGLFQLLTFDPVSLLAYLRVLPGQTLLIALNFSRKPRRLMLGRELTKKPWKLVLTSHQPHQAVVEKDYLSLRSYEAIILQQDG
jgi:alpha-glucosidase